ncbi:MAG TPA: PAS domain S-box protein [Desulfatiglandales bacterium]|nr:PAS domain S-box protein [Desulfatiglandales bacterium]
MIKKPTYEELLKSVKELEQEVIRLKQEKRALRLSQDYFRNVIYKSPNIIITVDLDRRIVEFNKAAEENFGYPKSDIIGKKIDILYANPSEGLEVHRKTCEQGHYAQEILNKKKNGYIFPCFLSSSLLHDSQGEIIGLMGVSHDITERKQAEKALRSSEEKYRSLVESTEDSIYLVDKNCRYLFMNKKHLARFGLTSDKIIGKSYGDFHTIEETKEFLQKVKKVFDPGSSLSYEYRSKRTKGFFLRTLSPIKDSKGRTTAVTIVSKDITERKHAEESLRESEEKYRKVVENANDAIFIIQDEVIKFPNPKTEEILGYSPQELAQIPWADLIHQKDRDMIVDRHNRIIKGENPSATYSFRVTNKDGEQLWAEINTVLIKWEGKPATLNLLRDVTPQKTLEVQLQQAQKMEAIGTLAGGIAHDFNNLLMGILGYASLMLLETDSNHLHYERLKGIEQQVQSGAELTKQLLGFARGGKYEVKPVDINELIKRSSRMFGRTKKEITIHGKYQKDIWPVEVDQGQIEQVLLNLYVNAWQAMPAGGELYIETQNITLDQSYAKPFTVEPGRYVKISITDTGSGMDKETQQRIFEPFFTTKEMGRGTGLGLASAYGIIKNHDGIINVYSEKGQGTTFTVYLPASEKEIVKEEKLPKELIKGTETILLVDDEAIVLDVGCKMLEKLGYKVLVAGSGKEAVEIYEKQKDNIDLVILDMVMPKMGGGAVFDRMKQIRPDVKALLSSGYSVNGQAKMILDRGCGGFIQKPFNTMELSVGVREILDKSRP